jgi:putative oxidoreductase
MKFMQRWAPHLLSILRIMAAGSFFTHGTMKLFSWPAPFDFPMNVMLYVAGILEVLGGFLLIIGLFSRPVAFLLSGLMAFAYFIVHASEGFFPVLNHGEAAMLYCFVFLYIAAAGPGSLSIDLLAERSQHSERAESAGFSRSDAM